MYGKLNMKKANLYSKRMQIFIRLISLLATIIIVISNTQRFLNFGLQNLLTEKFEFFTFIINSISIILFLIVILFPAKMGLFPILSFIYGTIILVFEPENNMGILLFWLSSVTLHARGFFNQKKKLKEIITSIIFCGLILSELRFGLDVFFNNLLEKLSYTFIYFVSLFFFQIYIKDELDILKNNKKLDLKNYCELRVRDAEWLGLILNGKKYDYLAITYDMSIGSVKNRIKVIFDVLEVGDKQGFLNKYSDFQICYGNDFYSIKKKKNIFFNV